MLSYRDAHCLHGVFHHQRNGFLYLRLIALLITDSTFSDNYAYIGSAISTHSESTLTVQQCNFTFNGVQNYGGAINSAGATLTIIDSNFIDNMAGAIKWWCDMVHSRSASD